MSLAHTAFSLQGRCQQSAFLSASFLLPLLLAELPPLPQVPEGVSRAPTCPTPAARLDSFSCDEENLGGELLRSAAFEGAGAWQTYTWQAGAADFYSGPAGALVDVKEQNPSKDFYAVSMVQDIELIPNGTESFELCLQAGASDAGTTIRFAVDGGMPDFHVPGSQERTELELSAGSLSSTCFRFALSPTLSRYAGRVAIELGHVVGQVAMCQVSLRRCKQKSYLPEALPAIRRCYVAPLGATQGCSKLETHSGAAFGLNALGHETDGKRACLEKLRLSGGNSFVFAPERCEIWSCADRDALVAASTGSADSAQVYSELCEYGEGVAGRQGAEARSPVFVNLWEWNFKDIARECEEFLGPNGFDAVQVMPVTEHVRDGSWFAKYQPVSMLLNSRSGTAEEFKCMVATCRAVGVEVIVDVILNHIAKPCDAVGAHGSDAVVPCSGWAGSRFGNRRMPSGSGWDAVGPQHFHHKVDDRMSNCPVNADTFQCPESDPPGDCSQCDLFGLPDWNTELPEVQDLLARHLRELHSLGVTMLRLDAASYIHEAELSKIVNQVPWDYVFQEWWAGIPAPSRTRYVGDYRDIFFGRQITKALVLDAASELPQLVNITFGLEGLAPQHSLCPLTFHDQRSVEYLQSVPTYKGGLEFHQQQKFLLASPAAVVVRLWGGFGYADLDDGPPGCRHTDVTCDPTPVYGEDGEDRCLPTPTTTPLDAAEAKAHRWICEHRWAGVAGLVGFRKACRGLPVSETFADSVAGGNFAFRTGDTCLVAVQRKMPGSGAWSLEGIVTGLPEGRYCDLASLPTKKGWDGKSCPNEVELGPGGAVVSGVVPEGDLLAIHAGARLPDLAAAALLASPAMAKSAGEAKACAAETELSSGARALQLGALLAAALPVAAASLLA